MCGSCNPGSRERTVTDARGRTWIFEVHYFCGPMVLRQDGEPRARQPGSRSPFWPAFEVWRASHAERRA